MNTYTIEQATDATLPDVYALHDPAEAAQKLPVLRQRIAEGRTRAERFWLLRSARGVEAVVNMTARPSIPLFPRYRADTPAEQVTAFLQHLKELVAVHPEQKLVLDSQFVHLDAAPVEAAGWVRDAAAYAIYETDLSPLTLPLAADAIEGGSELLQRPDVQALLHELGQSEWEGHPDRVVALPDTTGRVVALGAFSPSNRPGWVNLNIGVHPRVRGQGYGTRLHAHLLARAAERFERHGGSTQVDNHAMRRIFEKNGAKLISTQLSFRQS